MVLQGQDAWRKHPLIAGCWKRPAPGFAMAVGIFGAYCAADMFFSSVMATPSDGRPKVPKHTFIAEGDLGDTMASVKSVRGGGHH